MRRPNAATLFDDGASVNLTFSTREEKGAQTSRATRRAEGQTKVTFPVDYLCLALMGLW
jgi:hypothetical protein